MHKKQQITIAKKRIDILFRQAKRAAIKDRLDRADRYVELARKIAMRHNISIKSKWKRRICKECYSYLFPDKTAKTRISKGRLITKCLNCMTINRYDYKDK